MDYFRLRMKFGNDWASIGNAMGRSASSVKDKCRLMRDTCNSGTLYFMAISIYFNICYHKLFQNFNAIKQEIVDLFFIFRSIHMYILLWCTFDCTYDVYILLWCVLLTDASNTSVTS